MYEIFDNRIESYVVFLTVPFAWTARLVVWYMEWTTRDYVDRVALDWAKRGEGF